MMTIADLHKLASSLLDECGGDREEVTERLLRLGLDADDVRDAMLEFAARDLARQAVGRTRAQREEQIIASAAARGRDNARRDRDLARGLERNRARDQAWGFGFRLPIKGQPQLGDANRQQVAEGAEFYERLAGAHAARGRWLRAVCGAMPLVAGTPVRDALSEEQVKEMRAR